MDLFCEEAKYIDTNKLVLDIDNCFNCLKTREKCFHDKPRFNTAKIKLLLQSEFHAKTLDNLLHLIGP